MKRERERERESCLTESQALFRMTEGEEEKEEEQSRLVMHELSPLSTKDRSEINQSTKEVAEGGRKAKRSTRIHKVQ